MVHSNLHLQSDWKNDDKILQYTIYSLNSEMMQQWSEDILTAIRHWDMSSQPRILFDLSYPNIGMSYFVMSQREIFNVGITRNGKDYFLKFLESNPKTHIKLAVVLSNTMLGALSKYVPSNYEKDNFRGKIFFERDAAEDWLMVERGEEAFNTNSITSETLLRVIQELESSKEDVYGDRDFLRVLVKGSLEVIPIIQGRPIIVGRTSEADFDLGIFGEIARSVSRRHAQISLSNGRLSIIDLDSRNGTHISGRKVMAGQAVFINRDDVIRIGNIEFSIMF